MEQERTRVFFITDSLEDNEEIFDSLEEAREYFVKMKKVDKPRLYVAIVKNSFKELDGTWNYEDRLDTFEIIKFIIGGSSE